jgi:hypothetical protein
MFSSHFLCWNEAAVKNAASGKFCSILVDAVKGLLSSEKNAINKFGMMVAVIHQLLREVGDGQSTTALL